MKTQLKHAALLAVALLAGSTAYAQTNTMNRPSSTGTVPSTPMSESANMPTQAGVGSKSTGTDLAGSLASASDFSTLQQAVVAAGFAENAKSPGPYTVFAPSNAAFGKLPSGTLQSLTQPGRGTAANKAKLQQLVGYHVVSGNVLSSDLKDGQTIKTLSGGTLTVRKRGNAVMLTDAKGGSAMVTTADIQATNGTVHAIDAVLMPK